MIRDNLIFIREFLKEFETTGSVVPTSRWAAEALIKPLYPPRAPKRILEVGPGTGAVTVKILEAMIPGDELVVCELNPRFLQALREKLSKNPCYQKMAGKVSFFEGAIQDYQDSAKFDVIICAIPFLNLDAYTVRQIFEKLGTLSAKDGVMTYYEYIGLRNLGKIVPTKRKARLRELEVYFRTLEKRRVSRKPEWRNVPPIFIYTMRLAA